MKNKKLERSIESFKHASIGHICDDCTSQEKELHACKPETCTFVKDVEARFQECMVELRQIIQDAK